jgi:hypothetical protein
MGELFSLRMVPHCRRGVRILIVSLLEIKSVRNSTKSMLDFFLEFILEIPGYLYFFGRI